MNLPSAFNQQFFLPAVNGVAMVAASCQLFTRPAGNATGLLTTYQDKAGTTQNANPIILDADGRCSLFLNPASEYLFELRLPVAQGGAIIRQWDNSAAAAATTGTVSSVNAQTGTVQLNSPHIPYATNATAPWLSASTVEQALDQIITKINSVTAAQTAVNPRADFIGCWMSRADGVIPAWGLAAGATFTATAYPALAAIYPSLVVPAMRVGGVPVMSTAAFGTDSVGEVIAHTHTQQAPSNLQPQSGSTTQCYTGTTTVNTGSTGGTANLAAGTKSVWFMVAK